MYLATKRVLKCNPWCEGGLILFLKEENKEDFYEKLTIYFSLILTLLLITGCIRRDDLENIKITTTIEPHYLFNL